MTSIIVNYKASLASFDEPLDLTSEIGDGSSAGPWIQEFTGTGTTGSHTTNTWSTEANNGGDGTDMTTPFIEHWTGSGGILSDQKIYQKLPNLAPGLYKFTVDARVYNEASQLEKFEGIKMFFGNDSINLQDEVDIYYSGSKSVLWSKNVDESVAREVEEDDLLLTRFLALLSLANRGSDGVARLWSRDDTFCLSEESTSLESLQLRNIHSSHQTILQQLADDDTCTVVAQTTSMDVSRAEVVTECEHREQWRQGWPYGTEHPIPLARQHTPQCRSAHPVVPASTCGCLL